MKKKSGDPDFVYEISCDQMCGKGHYEMRGVIVVETQEEFDRWMALQQKPKYLIWRILRWIQMLQKHRQQIRQRLQQ